MIIIILDSIQYKYQVYAHLVIWLIYHFGVAQSHLMALDLRPRVMNCDLSFSDWSSLLVPPKCRFHRCHYWYFTGIIISINVNVITIVIITIKTIVTINPGCQWIWGWVWRWIWWWIWLWWRWRWCWWWWSRWWWWWCGCYCCLYWHRHDELDFFPGRSVHFRNL